MMENCDVVFDIFLLRRDGEELFSSLHIVLWHILRANHLNLSHCFIFSCHSWTGVSTKPRTNISVHQKRLKFMLMHPSVAEMAGQFSSGKQREADKHDLRKDYIFSNVLIIQNILVASLHLSVQTAAVNPKLMKWCAPHFLSTYFTQVFETFPTHWHCKITPSQNFRLSSPPLADCHNQFWFQINYSNFTYPLKLFTKAINVHYKFSSLGKDITEYKEHFKLWSINEVQGNTSVRKQNTLCSPFSHFQYNRSLSTYPGKQDAHLPTTEFELLCNILFK